MEVYLKTNSPELYDTIPTGGVKQLLSFNVVMAFSPVPPASISMFVGDTKTIEFSLDPNTDSYSIVQSSTPTTSGAGLTVA